MIERQRTDQGRITRFLGSLLFIGLGMRGIVVACNVEDLSPLFPLTIFVGYLIVSAGIITMIAGRLYAQHEIRLFRIDIANLILATTLVSLPFAVAGTFLNLIEQTIGDEFKDVKTSFNWFISAALFFFMFPVFFVTEALLSWWRILNHRDAQ